MEAPICKECRLPFQRTKDPDILSCPLCRGIFLIDRGPQKKAPPKCRKCRRPMVPKLDGVFVCMSCNIFVDADDDDTGAMIDPTKRLERQENYELNKQRPSSAHHRGGTYERTPKRLKTFGE